MQAAGCSIHIQNSLALREPVVLVWCFVNGTGQSFPSTHSKHTNYGSFHGILLNLKMHHRQLETCIPYTLHSIIFKLQYAT